MSLDIDILNPTGYLGAVPFCEKNGSMTEHAGKGGNKGNRILYVEWDNRREAVLELRGRTYPNPSNPALFIYVDPLTFPGNSNLQVENVSTKGIAQITATTNESINYEYAELTVTYGPAPNSNNLVPQSTVDRVTNTLRYSATADEFEIEGSKLYWDATTDKPITGGKVAVRVPVIEYSYEEGDRPTLPRTAIDSLLGLVNLTSWKGAEAKTLLFVGVDATQITTTDGQQPWNVTWKFLSRPGKPWSLILNPDRLGEIYSNNVDAGWFPVYYTPSGGTPVIWEIYPTGNFDNLF